jgi:hypothetical protein
MRVHAAIGMAHGAEAGLVALDALDAEPLPLLSRRARAVQNASERRFLTRRLEDRARHVPTAA